MKKRMWLLCAVALLLLIALCAMIIEKGKEMPQSTSYESEHYSTNSVQFLTDKTYVKNGERVMEQTLFTEMEAMIAEAEDVLVIDMFLFNDDYNRAKGTYPHAAKRLTEALLEKREQMPQLPITIITDNVNELYGATNSTFFNALQQANIAVVRTNMEPMRDSNLLYSSVQRAYFSWWPVSQNGFLPNAFNPDGGKGSIGAYLNMLHFKANHRKVVLNDKRALITSANLAHDGSSYHSNIGFIVEGAILNDIYKTEMAVAKMSGYEMPAHTFEASEDGPYTVQLVTEGAIKKSILEAINTTTAKAHIQLGIFYISDRDVVQALKEAAKRGVTVQVIMDPNKDAFGLEKNGIPNRQVAAELVKTGVEVRWYDTQGEQYHSKLLLVTQGDTVTAIGGSANFTRRNIEDYNLETNVRIEMDATMPLAQSLLAYFLTLWTNEQGNYTTDYEQYEDNTLWKKIVYRIQEWTGLSTF